MQVYTKSVEFKLTLLQPNTTYTIYLLATTDDPFEQARKASQIKTLTFTTKSFMILPNTSHMVLVTITTLLFLFLS
jgi:hypothetical protein